MTTAHRDTWKAARGGLQEEGSFRLHVPSAAISSKDAPTEANLKARVNTNISKEELRDRSGDVVQPLPKRQKRSRFGPASEMRPAPPFCVASPSAQYLPSVDETHASDLDEKSTHLQVQRDSILQNSAKMGMHSGDEPGDESDAESDAESDDDETELLTELENIRKERAYERAKRQAGREMQHENEPSRNIAGTSTTFRPDEKGGEFSETASVATGSLPGFAVQRRWNEDVVFRNDKTSERSREQRFINDTIRNDYHRKFMKRHIK